MTTTIIMDDLTARLRLMTWLSPAFPVGAFSYSHGLEQAAAQGDIADAAALLSWLSVLLDDGGLWNDLVLLTAAYAAVTSADAGALRECAELADALCPSLERRRETLSQGRAFAAATVAAWPDERLADLPADLAYPVAVGACAAASGAPLLPALAAYAQAFCGNLVAAAMRLSAIGQGDAVAVLATLEPRIADAARRAAVSTLDDLGGLCLISDICAMRHETLYSRIFIT